MNTFLVAVWLGIWATASASGSAFGSAFDSKWETPSCNVLLFGPTTSYILEVEPPAGGLRLNDVADAAAAYGITFDRLGGFALLGNGTLLIPASRLDRTTRPYPNKAELATHGINIFPDPRRWNPHASNGLGALRLAGIDSCRDLFQCSVTAPAGASLADVRDLLAETGALYIGGVPTSPEQNWEATVMMSPSTLEALGLSPPPPAGQLTIGDI